MASVQPLALATATQHQVCQGHPQSSSSIAAASRRFASGVPPPTNRRVAGPRQPQQQPQQQQAGRPAQPQPSKPQGTPLPPPDLKQLQRKAIKYAMNRVFLVTGIISGVGLVGIWVYQAYHGERPVIWTMLFGDGQTAADRLEQVKKEAIASAAAIAAASEKQQQQQQQQQQQPQPQLQQAADFQAPTVQMVQLNQEAVDLAEAIDMLFTVLLTEREAEMQAQLAAVSSAHSPASPVHKPAQPSPGEMGVDTGPTILELRDHIEQAMLAALERGMQEVKQAELTQLFQKQIKAHKLLEDQLYISSNFEYPDYQAAVARIAELESQLVLQAEVSRAQTQATVEEVRNRCVQETKALLESARHQEMQLLVQLADREIVRVAQSLTQQRVGLLENSLREEYELRHELAADALQASVREMYAVKQAEMLRVFDEQHAARQTMLKDLEHRIHAFEYLLQDYAEYERRSRQLQRVAACMLDVDSVVPSGKGFQEQWRQLLMASKFDPVVQLAAGALSPELVSQGMPTLTKLRQEFDKLETPARSQAYLPTYPTLWGHLFARAFGAVTLSERRLVDGDDDQSLITRAGFFLFECQDLSSAVAELEKLSERTKNVFSRFIDMCRGRLAMEQSLDAIRAEIRLQEAQLQ